MNRFRPSLESLDARITPSELNVVVYQPRPVALEGQQTLVFYLGGTPAHEESLAQSDDSANAADGRKYKILVAPLVIDLDGKALQPLAEDVVILTSSFPGGDACGELRGVLLVANQQASQDSVGSADSSWIDLDAPVLTSPDGPRYPNPS